MQKTILWQALAVILLVGSSILFSPTIPPQHAAGPVNEVVDWTSNYVFYRISGPAAAMLSTQHDPRAWLNWRRAARRRQSSAASNGQRHRDWSINLGIGGVAKGQYPAKFGFDISGPPSCPNDYVIFPVNTIGSAAQPNIVAFNNLYSGTVPNNGICNRTRTAIDDGVSATVLWS